MNVLVTGDKGYIGSVLVKLLLECGHTPVGYDIDFYKVKRESEPFYRHIKKDIRNVSSLDLKGIEAIIHLAALSNDPLGELDSKLTREINYLATVRLARLAKKSGGGKRFVYASTQSMYGISKSKSELTEDSEVNPVTTYAKTKWQSEQALKKLNSKDFTVVCLRPSTVFGKSPNLRTDIVFNNFLSYAYIKNRIEIKSDGTPWRPVVYVKDIARAFMFALEAPAKLVAGESFNVGLKNFTVKEIALAVKKLLPASKFVMSKKPNKDERTYRVSFDKIKKIGFTASTTLDQGGREMLDWFKDIDFTYQDFKRGHRINTLKKLYD